MNAYTPKSVAQYLDMLKDALKGSDPSMIRDALYDAEEYLRSELAANPDVSEADLLAQVSTSYGAPEEVADIYRSTEVTVQKALTPPKNVASGSAFKRFFAVAIDPHTYGAMFYMLLSLVTGIFYFTWATTGLSMSAGLMILIIGIPFFILFMASVYAISLVEGRLVETLLGERMPRRPVYQSSGRSWMERIKSLFADSRTWLSLMYMVLMLPLGVIYFTITVTLLALTVGFVIGPVLWWSEKAGWIAFHGHMQFGTGSLDPAVASPFMFIAGIGLLFVSLHIIRFIGRWHGRFAKHVLVESGAD
jgi:uncharacterized membrane protein